MIEFKNITKKFGNTVAVDHLNLEVKDGEIFGIAGPNGAGKTTIVRMLCTALRPDEGTIVINGLDTIKKELEVKRLIGYLPEEPNLYERLTGMRFLDFFGQLYGMNNRENRIKEVLKIMGLESRAGDRISTYSKGLRHRLSLARAILHDPKILVLDEPTMGLDPAVALSIRNLVYNMRDQKTIVICTHYMDEAEKLCNRMVILDKGKISAIGTPEELKKRASRETGRKLTLEEAFGHYTG